MAGGGFFFACEVYGGRFDESFLTCVFFVGFWNMRLAVVHHFHSIYHRHHHHQSLNCEGRRRTTDDLLPVVSIFPCSPLPSGTCRTPGLSVSWFCLPTCSPVCLVFVPLSLCLARWFWPDLMNGKHDHTTAVCVSLQSSGLCVVQLPAGSWHRLSHW